MLKSKDDIKQIYKTCKRILNWNPDAEYPSDTPSEKLPDRFSDFFYDKIVKINDSISATLLKETIEEISEDLRLCAQLSCFEPATEEDIKRAISTSSSALCELDPLHSAIIIIDPCTWSEHPQLCRRLTAISRFPFTGTRF